ncbi:hypothetical protein A9Q81_03505, partial [Gammaproteobacteria bacterium 42_54_T18]
KVFVALAIMGGMPTNIRAGKVMKLPPPAIELRTPPKTPAKKRKISSKNIVNNKSMSLKIS